MSTEPFRTLPANITKNTKLREPQLLAYEALELHFSDGEKHREVGVVLPVGCGKSGLITIAPFATKAKKVLVVAPGTDIADQLLKDFDPSKTKCFYRKCSVLPGPEYPEPAEIRGSKTNKSDVDAADVVITNIQQLQRDGHDNKWLTDLPADYFDLILFEEGHHNVAESWEILRTKFPEAKIVSVSATPRRADGQLMAGEIIYSYPIYRAIQQGFVKHIKGIQLNPKTLKYVRRGDGKEIEVDLEEVRRLGAEDASFRRSIVSSKETLDTIVDASIAELLRLREETGEKRLKIIASALNMEHCKQIVAAYRERRLRADYVHTNEKSAVNKKVMAELDNDELDVIVQVRKLGEGFDHPYLSVAAVFSIFAHLSPFVQFVGRIMRVIKHDAPGDPLNNGTVIFHAGANTTKAWDDFKEFAEADQKYFKLLTEETHIAGGSREVDPSRTFERDDPDQVDITEPGAVTLEEMSLLSDTRLREAFETLAKAGITPQDYAQELERTPVTKQARRQASRKELDEIIKTRASKLLHDHKVKQDGRTLDKQHLGKTNWIVVKSAIDRKAATLTGHKTGERPDYSQEQIDAIKAGLDDIIREVEDEVFVDANA